MLETQFQPMKYPIKMYGIAKLLFPILIEAVSLPTVWPFMWIAIQYMDVLQDVRQLHAMRSLYWTPLVLKKTESIG